MTNMKAIVIGNGFIASTHIDAIRSIGSDVDWIVGRDLARTEAYARKHNIPNWTCDLNEALSSDAQIVHICTPPYNHPSLIRDCLRAGKHVLCEKPLCIDPVEAASLALEAESAKARGQVTALCCNVRYYPANIEAARQIRSTYDGGPLVIHGSYLQEFHLPPHPDGWRFDAALSEGMRAISEIGTHWIDLAYAWTGQKIKEVFADLRSWYPTLYRKDGMLVIEKNDSPVNINTEDTAAILLRFEDGGIGCLLLSETAAGHPNDLFIEFTDMKTSYRWAESEPGTLYVSRDGSMQPVDCPIESHESTFKALLSDVYAAAAGKGCADFPDFEDGLYISLVCDAIMRSSQTQDWVPIIPAQ